jgi:hypothetical protein
VSTRVDDLTTAAVLNRAAALIETYGKAVGCYIDEDGGYCTIGAIRAVMFGDAEPYDMVGLGDPVWERYADILTWLGNRLNAVDPDFRVHGSMVVTWSDWTPQERVVEVLRAAAKAVS